MLSHDMLQKILWGKEVRVQHQEELINWFKRPLITFTVNSPGPDKNDPAYTLIYQKGVKEIEAVIKKMNWKIIHARSYVNEAGPVSMYVLPVEASVIKKKMMDLEENSSLGRLYDIDIHDENKRLLSRKAFGYMPRKCLVCDGYANDCRRAEKHTLEEVYMKIQQLMVY